MKKRDPIKFSIIYINQLERLVVLSIGLLFSLIPVLASFYIMDSVLGFIYLKLNIKLIFGRVWIDLVSRLAILILVSMPLVKIWRFITIKLLFPNLCKLFNDLASSDPGEY